MFRYIAAIGGIGIVAGGIYAYSVPTVSITVRLIEGGPDVTDRVDLQIAKVAGTQQGDTLRFTQLGQSSFPEIAGRTVLGPGTFQLKAEFAGGADLKETITLGRFEHADHEVILDAALVTARVTPGDPAIRQIELDYAFGDGGGGSASRSLPEEGPAHPLFASNVVSVHIADGTTRQDLGIAIVPETIEDIDVDLRRAALTFDIQPAPLWPEDVPVSVLMNVTDAAGNTGTHDYDTLRITLPDLPIGPYSIEIGVPEFSYSYGLDSISMPITHDGTVEPDQAGPVVVPLAIPVVDVTLTDAEALAGEHLTFAAAETADKGLPYGDAVASSDQPGTRIVVAPNSLDVEAPFGVFVYAKSGDAPERIVAFAEFGSLRPGEIVEVALALGDGHAGCVALYGKRSCAPILQAQ